jgi:hypothetical protein
MDFKPFAPHRQPVLAVDASTDASTSLPLIKGAGVGDQGFLEGGVCFPCFTEILTKI